MESKFGEVRKIHIVYFLSRGGHIEHPHMIKVHPAARNGVRLKDVKRWLSNIRGKDMPNSFAWSYKRRYKAGYVWQDLSDTDLITPICDNEYILKGCEILPSNQDNCKCGVKSPAQSLLVEELQNKNQLSEAPKPMLKIELPERETNSAEDFQSYSEPDSYKGRHHLKDGNTGVHNSDESEDIRSATEYLTKTSGNSPSKSVQNSGEAVKSYIAVRSPSTDLKFDAATQTGESRRFGYDKEESPPSPIIDNCFDNGAPFEASEKFHRSSSYSKLLCMNTDIVMFKNVKTPSKDSRQVKARAGGASNVLRQLFTCGGLETRDSRIHTVKTLTFNRPSNEEIRSQEAVNNSPSSTAPTKSESQRDLTASLKLSELMSPDTKSVTSISVVEFDKSDHLKRDVQNSPNFSPEHSSSSSTGKFAAGKIADIPSTDINSYCQDKDTDGVHVATVDASNNESELSVRSSPSKVSTSPTTLFNDLNTNLPSPKTDSKSDRKIKTPEVSSKVQSTCLQCGRSLKAEHLKAHSKYCRGPKHAIKSRRSIVAK